jgi:hypothetical protein
MPVISRFFGIVVRMNFRDHAPPHFHAEYGEYEAAVRIDPPTVLRGALPPRAAGMVMEWATLRRVELLDDWARAQSHRPLEPIAPLE